MSEIGSGRDFSSWSMLELFRMEIETNAATLNENLLALESQPNSASALDALMRSAHSIKGAARILELDSVARLAHQMEDCFVAARNGKIVLDAERADLLFRAVDWLLQIADTNDEEMEAWLSARSLELEEHVGCLQAIAAGEVVVLMPSAPVSPGQAASSDELFAIPDELPVPDEPIPEEPYPHELPIPNDFSPIPDEPIPEEPYPHELSIPSELSIPEEPYPDDLPVPDEPIPEEPYPLPDESFLSLDEFPASPGELSPLSADSPIPDETRPHESLPAEPVPALLEKRDDELAPQASASSSRFAPKKGRVVRVSAERLDALMELAGEAIVEANWLEPFADSLLELKQRQIELSGTLEKLQDAFALMSPASAEQLRRARLCDARCREILNERMSALEQFARRFAGLSDRLYRETIASHMRPFADGVQSFPRMVRDLARQLDKRVKLEILGKSTAVDRDILDKLESPLTHILRNAVDHGIESSAERLAAGKPPQGTISIEAVHRAGMLSITIEDDGRGVNLETLRQQIIRKKLAPSETVERLDEAELMEFLFLPGFSTSDRVTEISGRGVGLDVAKSMVQEVGGLLRASSTPGRGTRFHFQLPLTLSVLRVLLVEIAGNPYAFPLARIQRILTAPREGIFTIENRLYISANDTDICLVPADRILELKPVTTRPQHLLSVVTLGSLEAPYGLIVDRFLGERDLVVRPLDARLGKVRDVSATAILEDGSPVFVLDVEDIERASDKLLASGVTNAIRHKERQVVRKQRKRILVVDDSITVREVERKLLENSGFVVDVAVDGMEGWNAVRATSYDLVVTDVDMPRMNGIELASEIKQHPKLRKIPVIIVSYKDRESDRILGMEAGADYYLTKSSFHDDTLIRAVIDLIGDEA